MNPFGGGGVGGGESHYNSPYSPRSMSSTSNSCFHPLSVGSCSGRFRRFHFDNATNSCREFLYTGCGGNGNNYENGEHCKSICSAKSLVPIARVDPDIINLSCTQPLEKGTCGAFFPRYYFDSLSKQCIQFIYSGCSGNENNFYTGADCLQTCNGKSIVNLTITTPMEPEAPKDPARKKEICAQPVFKGSCERLMLRYYYNSRTNRCEEFIYTGCNGNQNNFIHGDHCVSFCNATGTDVLVSFVNPHDRSRSFNDWLNQGSLYPMVPQTYDAFNPFGGNVNAARPAGSYFDDDANAYISGQGGLYPGYGGNKRPQNNYMPHVAPRTPFHHPHAHNAMTPVNKMASACYLPPDFSRCQFNPTQYTAYYYDSSRRICQQYLYRGCHQLNSRNYNHNGNSNNNNNNNDMNINMGNFFSSSDIPSFNGDDFMKFAASNQLAPLRNLFATPDECLATCPAITASYPSPTSTLYLNAHRMPPKKLTAGWVDSFTFILALILIDQVIF